MTHTTWLRKQRNVFGSDDVIVCSLYMAEMKETKRHPQAAVTLASIQHAATTPLMTPLVKHHH